MSNTPEMVRLMRHAADLLEAAAQAGPALRGAIDAMTYSDDRTRVGALLISSQAAMVNAKATLRLLAAAMDDEPDAPAAIERGPGGRFAKRVT